MLRKTFWRNERLKLHYVHIQILKASIFHKILTCHIARHSTHAWETGRKTNHEDILVTQAYCLSPDFSQSSLWLKSFLFLSQRHRSISWLITSYVNSFKKSLPFPILISTDSAYLNQITLKKLFSNCYQPAQNHPMFLMSLKVVLIIMRF